MKTLISWHFILFQTATLVSEAMLVSDTIAASVPVWASEMETSDNLF